MFTSDEDVRALVFLFPEQYVTSVNQYSGHRELVYHPVGL